MTHPTPNEQDAMKNIERMLAEFGDASGAMVVLAGGRGFYDAQERRNNARAALLAAIRKLVSSTLPAHAQPSLAYIEVTHISINHGLTADAYKLPPGIYRLYASPTIPQAGKVLEALTKAHHALMTGLAISPAINATNAALAILRSLPQEEAAAQMQTEQDAKRYRWLRSDDIEVPQGQREIYVVMQRLPFREDQRDEVLTGSELDTAIDAALHRSEQSTDKEQG